MSDAMPKVDRCPLCRGEASITEGYVRCRSCHLCLPAVDGDTSDTLARKWNTRGTEVQGKEHTILVPYASEDDPHYEDTIRRTMWIAFNKDGVPLGSTLASTKALTEKLAKRMAVEKPFTRKEVYVRSAVTIAPTCIQLTIVELEDK